jgi:type IV secretion system protein TrbI
MTEIEGAEAPPTPPKADPETLVLRGRPRPVIRFRRGLIIGVTATAAAALVGLAWVALEPPSFRFAGGAEEPLSVSKVAADGLADAPATYADVPKLGPPLPGDLGRPILDQRRQLAGARDGIADAGRDPEAEREATERQRAAVEEQAVRTSSVLAQLSRALPAVTPSQAPVPAIPAVPAPDGAQAAAPSLGAQQHKLDFVRSGDGDINPHGVAEAPSPWTLAAGTLIPASLITGLNSDLPGMVVAQVTENVRDSASGQTVLIPQGARLIGSYDSGVAFGQQRALLVWHRILFPDGSSVRLDNMPAADAGGYAGLEDKVDFHEWRLLKGVALSSLLGVGGELGYGGDDRDLVRALRESAQQNGARAGDEIVSRNLDVQPTLTIRPGWPVRAILHKDLVLKPWSG